MKTGSSQFTAMVLVTALATFSFAGEYTLQTKLGHGYFYKTESSDDSVLNSQTFADSKFQALYTVKKSGEFLLLLHPEVQWNWESSYLAENQKMVAIWKLYEGYAKYTSGDFKLMAGKSIISWGSSDIINPVDFFGARDLTLLSAQTEKSRKGILAARYFLNQNVKSNLDFQMEAIVAYSEVQNTQLALMKQNWGPGVNELDHVVQAIPISYGLKTGLVTDQWDTSVFLYYGQNKGSELQIINISPSAVQIGPVHQNSKGLGIDGSVIFNKWIFRTEASYQQVALVKGQENLKSPDLAELVVGAERPLGEHMQIQGQYYQRKQLNYPTNNFDAANPIDTLTANLQIYNDYANGFIADIEYGFTLRLTALLFDDRLELQNAVMTFQEAKGYFFRSSVKWTGIDNLDLTLGTTQYSIDEATPLAAIKQMNHVFTEVSYVF